MKLILSLLGWALLLYCGGCFVSKYGQQWEFGAYGMPVSLLAEDGFHYRDGTEVDPMSLSIARSGYEAEVMLTFVIGLSTAVGWLVFDCWRLSRMAAELDRYKRKQRQ